MKTTLSTTQAKSATQTYANNFYRFLREHGTRKDTARRKAIQSEQFSRESCHGVFCVPSKLRGVASRQDYIKLHIRKGSSLHLESWNGEIQVLHRNRVVGVIGRQHTAWLTTLMETESGVECHVTQVTGGVGEKRFVGVNINLIVQPALDEYRTSQEAFLKAAFADELAREEV